MDQMALDDFLEMEPVCTGELICCSLSQDFHWIRITSGHTPSPFLKLVEFELDGYEFMYKDTPVKNEIISAFGGKVKVIPYSTHTDAARESATSHKKNISKMKRNPNSHEQ